MWEELLVARALRDGSIVSREEECVGVSPPCLEMFNGTIWEALWRRPRAIVGELQAAAQQLDRTCSVPLPCRPSPQIRTLPSDGAHADTSKKPRSDLGAASRWG